MYKARKKAKFRHEGEPELFALKYLEINQNPKDLLTEALFLKRCSKCPNIVNLYDTFLSEDFTYVIMVLELCKGSLSDIKHKLKAQEKVLVELFRQCADGLDFIHQK